MGEITAAYVGEGKYDVVVERIDSLQNQQGQVPANYSRSLIYSKLAMAMLETGKPLVAQKLLVAAQDLANVLPPREKAIATGFIAASQARSSAKEVATEKFRQANELLNSISDSSDRLSGYVDLTPAYALSGDRIGALAILQEILQTSSRVLTGKDRVVILSKIVPILADIDSVQAALKVSKQIENGSVRDKTLFQLMSERLVANEIYEAMAISNQFLSITYKAKAYAILARFQTDSDLRPLAKENFGRALSFAGDLNSPGAEAITVSEIARYRLESGDRKAAAKLMDRSLSSVKGMREPQYQDLVYAAVAKIKLAPASCQSPKKQPT